MRSTYYFGEHSILFLLQNKTRLRTVLVLSPMSRTRCRGKEYLQWKLWLVIIFSLMHVRKDNFREKKVKSVLGKYFQFPNLYLGVLVFWLLRIKSWFVICFQLQFYFLFFYYSVHHLKLNQKIIYLIKPTIHPSPSTSHHKPIGIGSFPFGNLSICPFHGLDFISQI